MNQHTRAEEPSMDEILASIRKIIAEDGSKPSPLPTPLPMQAAMAPSPAEPALRSATPVATSSPAVSDAPASLSAKLNDAFGYVPGADPARPLPTNVKPRTPVKSAIDDDLADILSDTPLPRATPAPSSSPPLDARPTDGFRLPDAPLALTQPAAAAKPAEPKAAASSVPPAPQQAAKPGPIVIAAAPRLKPSVEATQPPRATPAAAPPTLSSLNGFTAPPAATVSAAQSRPDVAAPSAPVILAAMPPLAKEKPTEPAPSVAPIPSAPQTPNAAPAAASPTQLSSLKAPEPAPVKDESSAAAVANALGSLEAGLAAVGRPAAPEIVVSAEEIMPSPRQADPAPSPGPNSLVSQQSGPAQAPTAASQGESVFSKPSAFIGGVALTPIKSFDDTAAELLRPMLREWLDSNMPRIVEKALKIEFAGPRDATAKPADGPEKPADKG